MSNCISYQFFNDYFTGFTNLIEETSTVNNGESIQHLRDIYSNAWLIKNLISNCFGWSLLSLLVEFTTELINFCYWTYINSVLIKSIEQILRKILNFENDCKMNKIDVTYFRNNLLYHNNISEFLLFLQNFRTMSKCSECKTISLEVDRFKKFKYHNLGTRNFKSITHSI